MKIITKQGDATKVSPDVNRGLIIAHVVNCVGAWGGGFVLALNNLSPIPRASYKAWIEQSNGSLPLGEVLLSEYAPACFVANMCAQMGKADADGCFLDYGALERVLLSTFLRALRLDCTVHMPAGIGCGLAGGNPEKVREIIEATAKKAERDSQIARLYKDHLNVDLEVQIVMWEFTDTTAPSYVKARSK